MPSSEKSAESSVYTNGKLTIDYSAGIAVLDGEELKLTRLDPDSGQVIVDGRILSLEYEQPSLKRGLFGRTRK